MPSPFMTNPDVMEKIRVMTSSDVQRVADLHRQAMGNSLWAQLGSPFLRELYRGMVDSDLFLGFVYAEHGQIEGFIAGSENPKQMMRQIFLSRAHSLALRGFLGLRRPAVALQLLQTARYFSESGDTQEDLPESLFCSFTPKLRGKRISGHINKVLFDSLLSRGFNRVKVTTEIDNVGANRQLLSWGFETTSKFRFYGKDMVAYQLDLEQSSRVQAKEWSLHLSRY